MTNQAENGSTPGFPRPHWQRVFWDWNGTLLDDRDYAIAVRNRVFPRFGLPLIESVAEYHAQFAFPVRLYYDRAGVTDENFIAVANAWMDEYMRGADSIPLQEGSLAALAAFQSAGIPQVILSASNIEVLSKQLAHYDLPGYFAEVLGLSHIYATAKQSIGEDYLRRTGIDPACCVLLGDTLHDAEVARDLGMNCILIAQGHQSLDTLKTAGVPVCATLWEAADTVLGCS